MAHYRAILNGAMSEPPPLTVLMTVHNGAPYLRLAMDSILQQTYRSFHFLIVDDASTDDTRQIIGSYADERIELLALERNVGQTAALNIGLRASTAPWIARMDADDYSAPTRLERQMQALAADSSLQCLGTHAWIFRDDPGTMDEIIRKPARHEEIAEALLQGSPIIHGSIVVSREALLDVGGYDERYRYSADLELYDRLLPKYRAGNVQEPLLGVRRHPQQGSMTTVAANENIEIFTRFLSSGRLSPGGRRVVLASLSYFSLSRARLLGAEGNRQGFMRDLTAAFQFSPLTSAKILTRYVVLKRFQALVKRLRP